MIHLYYLKNNSKRYRVEFYYNPSDKKYYDSTKKRIIASSIDELNKMILSNNTNYNNNPNDLLTFYLETKDKKHIKFYYHPPTNSYYNSKMEYITDDINILNTESLNGNETYYDNKNKIKYNLLFIICFIAILITLTLLIFI